MIYEPYTEITAHLQNNLENIISTIELLGRNSSPYKTEPVKKSS